MTQRSRLLALSTVLVWLALLSFPEPTRSETGDPYGTVTVQFDSEQYLVLESGGTATITVTLNQAASQEVKVNYATSDGTATAPATIRPPAAP